MRSSKGDLNAFNALLASRGLSIPAPKLNQLTAHPAQLSAVLNAALKLNGDNLLNQDNFNILLANSEHADAVDASLTLLLNGTGFLNQDKVTDILNDPEHAVQKSASIHAHQVKLRHQLSQLLLDTGFLTTRIYELIFTKENQPYLADLSAGIHKLLSLNILNKNKLSALFAAPQDAAQITDFLIKRDEILNAVYVIFRFLFLYNEEFWLKRLKYNTLGGIEVDIRDKSYKVPGRAEKIINVLLAQDPTGPAYENMVELLAIKLTASDALATSKKTTAIFECVEAFKVEQLKAFSDLKKLITARKKLTDFMREHDATYHWIEAYKDFIDAKTPEAVIDIFKNFLNITNEQSAQLIKLLTYEGRWELKLADIRSESDVIKFVHEKIGKKAWLKEGYDYSQFAETNADSKESNENLPRAVVENYYNLFKGIGLTDAPEYSAPDAPFISIVLEGSVIDVQNSIEILGQDLASKGAPLSQKILGIVSGRELATKEFPEETSIKNALLAKHLKPNAMNMVNYLVQNKLKSMAHRLNNLSYTEVMAEDDIYKTIKTNLATRFDLTNVPKPIIIAVYSAQPYAFNHRQALQKVLGDDFKVVCVSPAVTLAEFIQKPKSISVFLREVARLIEFNYTKENLEPYIEKLNQGHLKQLVLELERLYELSDYRKLEKANEIVLHKNKMLIYKYEAKEIAKSIAELDRQRKRDLADVDDKVKKIKEARQQAHPSQLLFKPPAKSEPVPGEDKVDDIKIEPDNKLLP